MPLVAIYENPTIAQMAQAITRYQNGGDSWTPLLATQPQGTKPPFFAILGTGATTYNFHHLAEALGQEQPFYTLRMPGADGRYPPFNNVPDLAAHYVAALRSVQPDGPYYLGGHSFGALVAFEAAHILRNQGDEVALLAIMDMVAPNYTLPDEKGDVLRSLLDTVGQIEQAFGVSLDISAADLAALDRDERINYLFQQLQMIELLPPDADISLVTNMIATEQEDRCLMGVCRFVSQTDFRAAVAHPSNAALWHGCDPGLPA